MRVKTKHMVHYAKELLDALVKSQVFTTLDKECVVALVAAVESQSLRQLF